MNIVTSGLPLAIGTSLALETYLPPTKPPYDPLREIPKPPQPLSYYDNIFINVSTLIRNLLRAYDGTPSVRDAVNTIKGDMYWMEEYITHVVEKIKVVFYISGVSNTTFPPSITPRLRKKTTAKAKAEYSLITSIIKELTKNSTLPIKHMVNGVAGDGISSSIVFTHFATDLLREKEHTEIIHLSSHTGNVINRDMFHKLYYPIPRTSMAIFPFNLYLLRFLGDKTFISPSPMKLRKALYEIALAKNWSSRTTIAKIKDNLKNKNLELYTLIFQSK